MSEKDVNAKIIWDYMLMHQELEARDAVFALGSNDTQVAEYAADLFLQNYGKYLIFAGGYGKMTLFTRPEAEVFADIAREKGVPEEKIIIENKSSNTGENILFVKKLLQEKGLDLKSFVLVQKPYMERRTWATFRKQWSEAEGIITSPDISYEEYADNPRYKDRWIDVMVGDLQRIKEYPAKGFQIPQEIPGNVLEAYEKLLKLGYDKYLIRD